MALPTIQSNLLVQPPAYLRKLVRGSHWGLAKDQIDADGLRQVAENVFPSNDSEFSLYVIGSDDDLRRVALGMNSKRSSLTEKLDLVAFRADEIEACGISVSRVNEHATNCDAANELHCNIEASATQCRQLCEMARSHGREKTSFSKSIMTSILAQAMEDQCRAAIPTSQNCTCGGGETVPLEAIVTGSP